MEEIQEIALVYYDNFSADEKRNVYQAFRKMDTNGDGTITIDVYEEVYGLDDRISFEDVDTNGDGEQDFEEFITLFYLANAAMVGCDDIGCDAGFINGMYFTCVQCFNHSRVNTFDLCASCYRYRNSDHNHNIFLDSHFLLRCKASYLRVDEEPIRPHPNQVQRYQPNQVQRYNSERSFNPQPNQVQRYNSQRAVVPYRNQVGSSASQSQISPQAGQLVRRTGSKRKVAKQILDVVTGGATIGQAVFPITGLCTVM